MSIEEACWTCKGTGKVKRRQDDPCRYGCAPTCRYLPARHVEGCICRHTTNGYIESVLTDPKCYVRREGIL